MGTIHCRRPICLERRRFFLTKRRRTQPYLIVKRRKKITAGIDSKDNQQYILHEALISFYNMRLGNTDSNDSYLTCFKSIIQKLELVGGDNFLYHINGGQGYGKREIPSYVYHQANRSWSIQNTPRSASIEFLPWPRWISHHLCKRI